MTLHDRLTDALTAERLVALGHTGLNGGTLVLVGPEEPNFWPHFTESAEYRDGRPDPLDRWSQRVLTELAQGLGAKPLFPFGGPPYQPFFSWALATQRFWPSPIGFLVHDTRGLMASFRGAILLDGSLAATPSAKPCDTCTAPCATACPVDAFADGYDVVACKAHVRSSEGHDCRTGGCLARRACPVGQGLRIPAQSQFHMEAFL